MTATRQEPVSGLPSELLDFATARIGELAQTVVKFTAADLERIGRDLYASVVSDVLDSHGSRSHALSRRFPERVRA